VMIIYTSQLIFLGANLVAQSEAVCARRFTAKGCCTEAC